MKKRLSIGYCLFLVGMAAVISMFFSGCKGAEQKIRPHWSSMDPLSIPLEVRKEQFAEMNLVFNPSFEEGESFKTEETQNDFHIEGWTKIGEHVGWVEESSKGKYSVKIVREEIQNETDELGEGVLSDFIEVIPGNYLFTYDVRLKDIYPNRWRLGTKLYDAVNIRLQFFDKKKKPLSGKVYYPYYEAYLDNSFKGYTFANFWSIVDFGWANVRARTFNYPFSEGDIPDNCRYVRLFLGLKGRGTMWVDNVDFRYSKWNFTPLERLAPFIKKTYAKSELLIPKPKSASQKQALKYYHKDTEKGPKPLIIIPENAVKQVRTAAKLIKSRLDEIFFKLLGEGHSTADIKILTRLTHEMNGLKPLIISVGRTGLYEAHKKDLPCAEIEGKEQAYFIRGLDEQNLLFLKGSGPIGDYYAATTAVQLLDDEDFIFHSTDVIDFPDFLGRSYLFDAWNSTESMEDDISNMTRMSLLKLNKAYVGYGQTHGRKNWYAPDDLYIDGVRKAGSVCRQTGVMNLAIMINPYYHLEYEMDVKDMSDSLRYVWRHGNPKDMQTLKNVFQIGLDAGANCIMLMGDDFVPHEADYRKIYSLWTPEDKEQFTNLQNAQAFMINELYTWLSIDYQGTRFEFCPPWYLNEFIDKSRGKAEQYFEDLMLQIPEDVAIIWTGNTVRSLSHDMADIERYRKLIGRYPMLWDNTLYARGLTGNYGGYARYYPGKVRMCNLFEPLDLFLPQDFYKYNHGAHMYTNGSAFSETYKIKYSTVADFEWNNNDYEADFSLWKVLLSQFGKDLALKLLEFNDAYYGLVDMCMRIERTDDDNIFIRRGKDFIAALNSSYAVIDKSLPDNRKLAAELHDFREKQIKIYDKLASGKI